jgi:hypothetical protein
MAGGDELQPPPDQPDAAYYKRVAAMRAIQEQRARHN